MKIVLLGAMACALRDSLRGKLTEPHEVASHPDVTDSAALRRDLAAADVVVAMEYRRTLPPAPRLRLLQIPGAGTDKIDFESLPARAAVCNAFGHETAVAEYAILGMLMWSRRALETDASFRRGSWAASSRTGGPLQDDLEGKTVGILGLGRIGRAVAERARSLGCTVLACTRTVPHDDPAMSRVYTTQHIDAFLSECDFVVVACSLNEATFGFIDAQRLAALRPAAVLINVARGECIDAEALYQACADRRIGGAVLDAWYEYPSAQTPDPAPSRFPFHTLPNVIVTPHTAAWTRGMVERRVSQMAANINRHARGEPLANLVRSRAARTE